MSRNYDSPMTRALCAIASGGLYSNPILRNVHIGGKGRCAALTVRDVRRYRQKARGICLNKHKKFWELQKMNYREINKRLINHLRHLSDDHELIIEQNKHIKVTGTFLGQQRSITLCCSPSSSYPSYLRSRLRRFLRGIDPEMDPRPIF